MRTTQKLTVGAGLVFALVAAFFAVPEEVAAQDLAQVYEVTPKQGSQQALESALKRHSEWREEHGDPWDWDIYQVVQGKNYGTFLIRSPNHSWSDFDEYGQGFGSEAYQHYQATVAPLVKSTESYIQEVDTAASHGPEVEDADNPLVEVTTYNLKSDRAGDFFDALTQLVDALAEQDYSEPYYVFDVVVGAGAESHAQLVNVHRNWSDFEDEDPSAGELIEKVHGEEKTEKLFDQFTSSFNSSYSSVLAPRPDLSVEAASGEMDSGGR